MKNTKTTNPLRKPLIVSKEFVVWRNEFRTRASRWPNESECYDAGSTNEREKEIPLATVAMQKLMPLLSLRFDKPTPSVVMIQAKLDLERLGVKET